MSFTREFDIGVDARVLRHTGIGTYLRGILGSWTVTEASRKYRIGLFGGKKGFEGFPHRFFDAPIYSVREQWEYTRLLKQCRLWHAPHYNIPVISGNTKLVVTVHDLIHWVFRKEFLSPLKQFYAGFMLRQVIQKADRIIAVSVKTRDDLIAYFHADPDKISVVYEGVDVRFREIHDAAKVTAVLSKYAIPQNYFLYVGMLKPHKQVHRLIRAFRALRQEGKLEADLVIVGKKDKTYAPGFEELARLGTGEGIVHLTFVEDEELVMLYNGALALIHPSLYEGFGLTLLEAMACGTPVIARRAGSIPEVTGEAGLLFGDDEQMTGMMLRIAGDRSLREELRCKGKQQAARFKWQDAARETARIYEEVLSGS